MKRSYLKRKKPLRRKKYGGQYTHSKYSVKTKYIRALKKVLDGLVQKIYVPVNPTCFICPNPTSCMHHYVQKLASMYLRWDKRNLVPLCQECHCSHHQGGNPRIHQEIIRKKGHAWADELERDRRILFKCTVENLEEVHQRLMGGEEK